MIKTINKYHNKHRYSYTGKNLKNEVNIPKISACAMTFRKTLLFTLALCIILVSACKKDEAPLNPFDRNEDGNTVVVDSLKAKSIEGLYQNIFKPNCSTSGCHDGTFAPDFRTIESSYNTLVWSDIINNDPSLAIDFRVKPSESNKSMLVNRLTSFVPNTSGIMPLEVSPDSDWNEKKEQYIQDVRDWINEGAKDISGNVATEINLKPQLTGFYITAAGSSTPFPRNVNGVIKVPSTATNIDLYIGIEDKETSSDLLTINELLLSKAQNNFDQATTYNMSIINPITNLGYGGNNTSYYHKVSISGIDMLYQNDEYVFIKAIVNDAVNENANLPGENTLDHIKYYYSFKRVL
ncbi:MAG: hypothetical protein ACPG4Y_06690 [Chitinophagales bacterium]